MIHLKKANNIFCTVKVKGYQSLFDKVLDILFPRVKEGKKNGKNMRVRK